ncbi:AfsR/SARP family transcriptional regulator [Streptomyces marincola]|uniref:AfsR/SARP family transcriptional regulator n=1 Tax=Streptomyces marincola TaxID=2878388 RepID=UPI001CF57DE6|nr:BTAD domain-containing putative transcriptional regulator [Streptomyces marincola]UCM86479.1 winged helix-turn-helix domain-containing protein [Streptomyces marincola]
MADGLRFELLGPLRASGPRGEVPLGAPRQRAVLAVLLLQEGRPLSYAALVDALWGEEPPAHVRNLVQKYVSGLRRAFASAGGGPGVPQLRWTGSGYLLTGAEAADVRERLALLGRARVARDAGDLRTAVRLAGEAEALWRGEFAEGLAGPFLAAERLRWAEKRLMLLEARLEGELRLGRYHECVHELVRQVAAHPLRERLVWLLMLARYRSGQASAALTEFEEARRRIAVEMGADPGPALRALHERILRQDPGLLLAEPALVS